MSFSTPTLKIHHTAGCVILDSLNPVETHMLLIYRVWPVAPQGAYILPKGHVEAGETTEAAALRETIEETGYTNLRILKRLSHDTIEYTRGEQAHRKHLTWYLALLEDNTQEPIELTETEQASLEFKLVWKPVEEALELLQNSPLDAEKSILEPLDKYLKSSTDNVAE